MMLSPGIPRNAGLCNHYGLTKLSIGHFSSPCVFLTARGFTSVLMVAKVDVEHVVVHDGDSDDVGDGGGIMDGVCWLEHTSNCMVSFLMCDLDDDVSG